MIYFNKKSFFAPFFAVFFAVMVIMGSGQAFIGTLRWYNPSEEGHEKLSTAQVYTTVKTPEKPKKTSLFIPEKAESIDAYFADNRDDIQTALQTVSPEKAQKITVRIEQMSQSTTITPPEVITPVIDTFESPISLEVRPDSASAPI